MKFKPLLGLLIPAVFASGCGSSGDDANSAKEFSQSVDLVQYGINRVEVKAMLGTKDDSAAENLQKEISQNGKAKDSVERRIKGSDFILVINGQESAIQVSSAGKIDHQQNTAENTPGCSLVGTSKVSGEASSIKIDLSWELNADLKGDSCDSAMIAKYFKFQNDELQIFHLQAVNNVLASADLPQDFQRSIHLSLKVTGDSH